MAIGTGGLSQMRCVTHRELGQGIWASMTHDQNATALVDIMYEVARPVGYTRSGSLFWKASESLTRLLQFQKSRWGDGVYVNVGVTPNKMVTKSTPPGTGYWALEVRPTSWKSRYFQTFRRLEDGEAVDADEAQLALHWLIRWMERSFDDESVRQALQSPGSWIADLGVATAIIKDWASGSLRAPQHYFAEPTRYYG